MSIQPITPQAPDAPASASPFAAVLASVTAIGVPPLMSAAATLDRANEEITGIWSAAMLAADATALDRLAGVSHLLRRATRLLDDAHDIG